MREIRFSLGSERGEPLTNSYAGWPPAVGIEPFLTLRAIVAGRPDRRTGYLLNITVIDQLLRERSIPLARRLFSSGSGGEHMISALARDLYDHPPAGTRWIGWHLKITPFATYSVEAGAPKMVYLTQTFEFAAAHRLHCPAMSDEENRTYFGKCNNPNGHGHNYVLEVSIKGECDGKSAGLLPVAQLERIVNQRVLDRFDHKHLNEDCPEFRDLNPSVENIARTIWGLLDGHLEPASLARVRVWETSKTYAEYDGEDEGR